MVNHWVPKLLKGFNTKPWSSDDKMDTSQDPKGRQDRTFFSALDRGPKLGGRGDKSARDWKIGIGCLPKIRTTKKGVRRGLTIQELGYRWI